MIDDEDRKRLEAWTRGESHQRKSRSKSEPKRKRDGPETRDSTQELGGFSEELRKAFSEPLSVEERIHKPSRKNLREERTPPTPPHREESDEPAERPPRRPTRRPVKVVRRKAWADSKTSGESPSPQVEEESQARQLRKPEQRAPAFRWREDLPGFESGSLVRQEKWERLLVVSPGEVAENRFYSVGVDAGTSGIRVAAYHELSGEFSLYDFGENVCGGSRFSLPAVAGVCDGRLLLGNRATEVPASKRFASFKAGLIHPEVSASLARRWDRLDLAGKEAVCGLSGPGPADFFHTILIAQALDEALPTLLGLTGREWTPTYCTITLGAPSRRNRRHRVPRFQRCLDAAVRLMGTVEENARLEILLSRFAAAWAGARTEADAETRRTFVRPEARAVLRSLQRLLLPGRNLLLGDIGATTTEVVVVRVGADAAHAYSGESVPVGVDELDKALAGADDEHLDVIAARHRRLTDEGWMRTRTLQEAAGPLRTKIRRAIRQALQSAWELNPDLPSWKQMYVAVAGGGSHIPAIARAFDLKTGGRHFVQDFRKVQIALPKCRVVGTSAERPRPVERAELVSVFGSAAPEWDDIQFSDEDLQPVIPIAPDGPRFRPRWV